jgi:2,3-bisphosphoglycerate-dependent phosphoglycerate mutase
MYLQKNNMAYLALIRHGQSKWNAEGLWTGWTDIDLNEKGVEEAQKAAEAIKDIPFSVAHTSDLIRARHTLDEMLKALQLDIPITVDKALREKHYGDYAGKNKWQIKEQVGEEEFQKIRRSWDYVLPNGESLLNVYERVVPYYEKRILPDLESGKNVLVSSHGNTLRALVKYLENIADDQISGLEIGTGEAYLYTIDENGKVIGKDVRSANPNAGKI